MRAVLLSFLLCLGCGVLAAELPAQEASWAEEYLKSHHSHLLDGSDKDHVMSVYFFGRINNYSLMGLERVQGDDYEQHFTLLIFEDKNLIGYYQNVLSFPSLISPQGEVSFPLGIKTYYQKSRRPLTIAPSQQPEALCQEQGENSQCFPYHNLK